MGSQHLSARLVRVGLSWPQMFANGTCLSQLAEGCHARHSWMLLVQLVPVNRSWLLMVPDD